MEHMPLVGINLYEILRIK